MRVPSRTVPLWNDLQLAINKCPSKPPPMWNCNFVQLAPNYYLKSTTCIRNRGRLLDQTLYILGDDPTSVEISNARNKGRRLRLGIPNNGLSNFIVFDVMFAAFLSSSYIHYACNTSRRMVLVLSFLYLLQRSLRHFHLWARLTFCLFITIW